MKFLREFFARAPAGRDFPQEMNEFAEFAGRMLGLDSLFVAAGAVEELVTLTGKFTSLAPGPSKQWDC